MGITLREWNNLVSYGYKLCNNLRKNGYDVRLRIYKNYNGKSGLTMQVFDALGKFFTEYYSGIGTYKMMKDNMCRNAQRIVMEC